MESIVDFLRIEIAKQTENPEIARLLVLGLLKEIEKELKSTDWTSFFEELERDPLIQVSRKPAPRKNHYYPFSGNLPPGTVCAQDFFKKYGLSYNKYRHHALQGIGGDLLEITKIKHYPATRPNYTIHYLTPEQQQKAIAYWKRYGVPYEKHH